MSNKIYTKFMLLLASFGLLFSGCEKSDLMPYTGGNTVGFWVHSINHSFYGEGVETLPVDTVELDLAITGNIVDYDRYVDGTFIPDIAGTEEKDLKNTAVEGKDYKILGGIVKANEEYGKFRVEVYNQDALKDKELKLNLAIKENKDFSAGLGENRSIVITWSQKVMRPATWNAMRFFFCSTYSTQVYRIFMQVTGLKEFYYYEGIVSVDEAYVMGRNFGNVVRAYEKEHGTPMLHDDGTGIGTPIIPLH
ncbi:MAG: DUF4843 domain-containing protein [Odoribacter sp.]|nr:DUF4843 domain-containing protein [Odoribacter sp.]